MSNKTVFQMVEEFNKEVVQIPSRDIGPIEEVEEVGFFVGTLHEEIEEFEEAQDQDFIAQIDSIMDLIYFACGGLVRMGVPAELQQKIFEAIHEANMTKQGGMKDSRDITHDLDAVKPEGWIGPEDRIIKLIECFKCEQNLDK